MKAIGKDNIALEKGKQASLMKAVKRVKKEKKAKEEVLASKGVIMLKHVPHGFYEKEMKSYFAQFGKVLRVRVARSKKTGKSRGYAYVEFEFQEVAKIAAEAMNNYLMFERLIKCELLPPTANARKIFRDRYIREDKYPKLIARNKQIAAQDVELAEEESASILQQRVNKLKEQNKRLAEMGIDYQFKVKEEEGHTPAITDAQVEEEEEAECAEEAELSPKSPKLLKKKNRKSEAEPTTPAPINEKPKFSPKLLRNRKSEGATLTPVNKANVKTPSKGKISDLPRISPKMLRSRKSEAAPATPTPAPNLKSKFSPKMLRNRKSEGATLTPVNKANAKTPAAKGKVSDLPKISPKMLRSRKSDAQFLTLDRKGRKSVI